MPHPQPDPRREREDRSAGRALDRVAIHKAVLCDDTPDGRLVKRPSNREKVEQICRITGAKQSDIDLTIEPSFDQWLRSMDEQKAVAGLYMSSLRADYHRRLYEPQEEAVNEWWNEQFDNMLTLLYTGAPPPPKRLH
ncbi:hypothetical protein CcrC1_gp208 [Caulobacter phage C1]|nr:hypothetical protein CcrC1_gp208 [Caulobacter phage C1]UTU08437.1 hypothetical protein CcrC2_gp209 [Caulobacter phage C2]UTU08954.1 hypothetical protein CcrJ4_gp203 [Caulobacter phage J4]UTU09512.1 hypothetical protein CcrBL47_gp226 [Caulobacter phage BL47]UTU10070.1 hypothetical protein CcrRB23_gp208 [Caulobacter phage RB23]WGN97105.1 hypothetical protein [Bertelyvirus sp.]